MAMGCHKAVAWGKKESAAAGRVYSAESRAMMSKCLPGRSLMPFYLHQVSYTPEALARLIANPQDRFEAVRIPIEKLGGKIKDSYFAFGQHDAVIITEMPDNVSAAAIALAFAAGGALRNCQTTALMTNAEALEAMRKAGTCGYKSITATAASAHP